MENIINTEEQSSAKDDRWMKKWQEAGLFLTPPLDKERNKFYCLDMFPYPSGSGLHVGHVEGYTASDIISRFRRMKGDAVLHPMGWDAFGLPAENFAIKTGVHPNITTDKAIETFKGQMDSLGLSYDWSKEIQTSKPEYYKWTQWFFLLLYKNGLAYKKKGRVNWCESCQTVLANEQAENGVCERCGNTVIQKELEQWYFKISDFIEDSEGTNGLVKGLISGLETIDWPDSTKAAQKNWIGRSTGVEFDIPLEAHDEVIKVYTTRIDTVFGLTYVVLAPEHELIKKLKFENKSEVDEYLQSVKTKTELERMEAKEKTGVELKGLKAINPFTKELIPVFIADYVLVNYGTGAVMAVPAHDERDFVFAKKYGLAIRQSIAENLDEYNATKKTLDVLKNIYEKTQEEKIDFWLLGGLACAFEAGIVYRKHDDLDLIVKEEEQRLRFISIIEDLGFKKIGEKKISDKLTNTIYKNSDDIEIDIGPFSEENGLTQEDFDSDEKTLNDYKCKTIGMGYIKKFKKYQLESRAKKKDQQDMEYLSGKVYTDDGVLVDSGVYSGLGSEEARVKMAEWLEKGGLGKSKVNYRLRDWLVSRQRYWGAPIPILYCGVCGEVPVPEKDLPVLLPLDVDFKPTGESPLVNSKSFHERVCPKCGGPARMENDTMDTFVCSSWYYFRFLNPHLEDKFADTDDIKKWMPIDVYIGGAEHSVLHLLYARFFTKVLHRLGYISFNEPFLKLRHPGTILAEDGTKMSKSKGNVVNPDDVIRTYGPDSLRLHEMFLGAFDDLKPWNTKAIAGVKRFLEKIKNLSEKIKEDSTLDMTVYANTSKELNRSIKKVGEDISEFKFNTAISQLMILVNEMSTFDAIPKSYFEKLLLILAPLAPFSAEDMWEKIGNGFSIHQQAWPAYDEKELVSLEVNLAVQINGKTRGVIVVNLGASEDEVVALALADEKLSKYLEGGVKKVIFIKDKILSFIV